MLRTSVGKGSNRQDGLELPNGARAWKMDACESRVTAWQRSGCMDKANHTPPFKFHQDFELGL